MPEVFDGLLFEIRIIAAQRFAQGGFGRRSGDAVEQPADVGDAAGLHDRFHHGERPRIGKGREFPDSASHEPSSEPSDGIPFCAAGSSNALDAPLLRRPSIHCAMPSCSQVGARPCDFCPTKLCVSSCFSTRASSGVTPLSPCTGMRMRPSLSAPDPTGRARDVGKILPGVEDHADLFGRRVVELRFDVAKIVFERAQDAAR